MAEEAARQPALSTLHEIPTHPAHALPDDGASEVTDMGYAKFEPIRREPTVEDVVNLPFRTLSNNANMDEYTQETISGQMLREVRSNATGLIERYELVTFKIDDPANPKNWTKAYKWWCTMVVAMTCFVVAFNSAVITADLEGVSEEFHVSEEVSLLTISKLKCAKLACDIY
jgi:hypothetical protein